VAVDPTGKFAYVTNSASNDVSMYTINATTGALTSTGMIATGTVPVSVAVDPAGKFAYVTNSASNDVSIYSIDAATGALTLIGTIGT
jgi:YVTN family beta-propeller protein